MKFTQLLALLAFCAGAGFVLSDIGVDGFLAYDYANYRYVNDTIGYQWKGFLATDPLGDASYFFMLFTAGFILLFGLVQSAMVIYLLVRRDSRLSTVPRPVRLLFICMAPILMAPAVANIYGAYQVIRKKPDAEILKTKKLIGALKMAEVGEGLFQLFIQLVAVGLMVAFSSQTHMGISGMPTSLTLSIISSTLTIVHSTVTKIAMSRQRQFISPHYPALASQIPLFLFLLTGIVAGTTHARFFVAFVTTVDFPAGTFPVEIPAGIFISKFFQPHPFSSYYFLNVFAGLFSFLILNLTCQKLCWRIVRTIIHFFLVGSALSCIIIVMATSKDFFNPDHENSIYGLNAIHTFHLNIFCTVAHLLLGLLVLPSKELAPTLFSPLVNVLFWCLRRLGSSDCLMKWREDINEYLDAAEHGRVGGEEEPGEYIAVYRVEHDLGLEHQCSIGPDNVDDNVGDNVRDNVRDSMHVEGKEGAEEGGAEGEGGRDGTVYQVEGEQGTANPPFEEDLQARAAASDDQTPLCCS